MPADRLEQIYPSTYYSFASGSGAGEGLAARIKGRLDARAYRRALDLIDGEAPRILDVGGGTGEISAGFVRESGGRATATVVDIDPDSIEAARSRGLQGFVGRIEEFDTDERFDLVLMLNLIEHVADPLSVLGSARALLAPGGIAWLQTPNFRALDGRIFRTHNWAGFHCPRHWAIFSEAGLRSALERSRLEPVRFQRTQGGSFWAQSLLGLRRIKDPTGGEGLPRPLIASPAFGPVAAAGAAFDIATRRFRQVSQVAVMARAAG